MHSYMSQIHTYMYIHTCIHSYIHVIYSYLNAFILTYIHSYFHCIHTCHAFIAYILCIPTVPYIPCIHSYIHSYMACVHTFIAFIHVIHSYLHVMHAFILTCIHTYIHVFANTCHALLHTFHAHAFIHTVMRSYFPYIHSYMHAMHWYMSCIQYSYMPWVHKLTCHVLTTSDQSRENTFADVASHRHHSKISGLPDSLWHLESFRFHFELDWMVVRVARVLHPLIIEIEMHMHPPNSCEMSISKWLWNFDKTLSWARTRVYILKPLVFEHLFAGVLQSSGTWASTAILKHCWHRG